MGRWVFVGAYCVWNDLLGINVFWKLNQIHHDTKNLKQDWMFCEVSFVSALRQLQCQNYEGWVSPFCWRQVQEPLQDFQMRTTRGGRFFLMDESWRQQTGILSNAVTLNLRHGGVQVAESSVEVLKQADIIFKVNEPLLDEVGQKRSG